jgi:hypothetical protein
MGDDAGGDTNRMDADSTNRFPEDSKTDAKKDNKEIIIGFQIPAYDTISKLHTHSTHLQDQYTTDEVDA